MTATKRNLLKTLEKVSMSQPKTPSNAGTSVLTQLLVFSTVKVCKSSADVLNVISGMIQEKPLLEDNDTTALNPQLNEVGINTESSFAMMKERILWPLPSDLTDKKNDTFLIKTPILSRLYEVAEYMGRMCESRCFLSLGVMYKPLFKRAKVHENPGKNDAQSTTQGPQGRLPTFNVPSYEGDALKGDVYIIKILNAFMSAGQSKFLTDVSHCIPNQAAPTKWL